MKRTIMMFLFLVSFTSFGSNKVIYGEDNRLNPADASQMMQELSLSTAGMARPENIEFDGDFAIIKGKTLEERGICPTERFAQQISAVGCSGFLVAKDLLVTAGHCMRTNSSCKKNKWVFGYVDNTNGKPFVTVKKSNVYNCRKIVSKSINMFTKNDYALIQLDRNVTDRKPLKVRTNGKIDNNANVTVIGHPTGLPTKIAGEGFIRDNSAKKYFITNVDSFAGNSGSAVFNSDTGIVEGILVRGDKDYVTNGGCIVPNHCSMNECRGEGVTRITNIKKLMNRL